MTAYGSIPKAVEAVRSGAADYLTKPLESPAALRALVGRVLGTRDGQGAPARPEFLTRDPAVLEQLALLDRAAATDATVLITGESGTGKELLAHRLHRRSRRGAAPFVVVNCAALPESLAESELFGHERGAFTGADRRRRGRFEAADGGTLFLDEAGELSLSLQTKLLRVLEERVVERVGGGAPISVDIRLVAATNRDLAAQVEAGHFRTDLFYRLNVVAVRIPPLRERPGDVALLAERLIARSAAKLGLPAKPISAEAMAALRAHSWPGNVRELRNVLERALIAARKEIGRADLPNLEGSASIPPGEGGALQTAGPSPAAPLSLEARERQAILEALDRTGGHREKAAKLLGISVRTLYKRLKQYGIG
jgi:DNA-binding NtrC family response regulator